MGGQGVLPPCYLHVHCFMCMPLFSNNFSRSYLWAQNYYFCIYQCRHTQTSPPPPGHIHVCTATFQPQPATWLPLLQEDKGKNPVEQRTSWCCPSNMRKVINSQVFIILRKLLLKCDNITRWPCQKDSVVLQNLPKHLAETCAHLSNLGLPSMERWALYGSGKLLCVSWWVSGHLQSRICSVCLHKCSQYNEGHQQACSWQGSAWPPSKQQLPSILLTMSS